MRQFCYAVTGSKQDVIAIGLRVLLQGTVGDVDQDREIGEGAGHVGVTYGDSQPIRPR